ncbi:class I SAM-dependent methyltransferase [Streptomyces sp. NPDC002402]
MSNHPVNPQSLSPTEQQLQQGFNAWHRARASTDLLPRLYAAAMGDAYPDEVAAFSSCDWAVLGEMVTRLRMRPGQVLLDLGCGTGGVGLWLARALNLRLLGIDISDAAIELAAARRSLFVAPDRAEFRVGTLQASGMRDSVADGVVCMDAVGFAPDRAAALCEIYRILRPGARAVLTRAGRIGVDLVGPAESAGFEVEHVQERPDEPELWRRLYGLWVAHEADLRRELGDAQAETMLGEGARMLPRLDGRRAVIVTLRRPDPLQPSR